MLIEPDYRGFRIEVNALAEGDLWNADVMIRRTLSSDKPRHDRVTCYKLQAELAEHAALIWATRFIDARGAEERP